MRDVKAGLTLTLEAQNRLDEAIRNRLFDEGELEPKVLQELANYPEEVQKNVIDKFVTSFQSTDVTNKTGWLVGIFKREIRQYQESIRFRSLDPSVGNKLENALRARKLRIDEIPAAIIGILAKSGVQEQNLVVDKFLRNPPHVAQGNGVKGRNSANGAPTQRSSLFDVMRAELGPRALQEYGAHDYGNGRRDYYQKDGRETTMRTNLQKTLPLHEDVIQMLLSHGDSELYDKLATVGGLPPNYLDSDRMWALLAELTPDEQLRIVREMATAHGEAHGEKDLSRYAVEKRREEFRVVVERIMLSYGFQDFGGQSKVPEMRGRISVSEDGVTTFDFSDLTLCDAEWKREFSPATKRKLKKFMSGRSPALVLDFSRSKVGETLGSCLLEFFAKEKPNLDVSLVTLKLTDTDLQTDQGWNDIASFLLTTPARELELSTSKVSSLSLGILVHTMFDGEFPNCAPFYMLPDANPPRLAITLPNNTKIRFPPSNELWVTQWLAAGQLLIDSDTLLQVQHIYQYLRMRGTNPAQWCETPQWNSPIHPARVDMMYTKLRHQGYVSPREEDPHAHKSYNTHHSHSGYYYDARYHGYYDDYSYMKWPPHGRAPRRGSMPEVYDMGGKENRNLGYGMHSFDYRGPPVRGDFRREYGMTAHTPAHLQVPGQVPRRQGTVVMDVREEHEMALAAVQQRPKKGRNKMPIPVVEELNQT